MNPAGRAFHRWDLAFPQMGKAGGLAAGFWHVRTVFLNCAISSLARPPNTLEHPDYEAANRFLIKARQEMTNGQPFGECGQPKAPPILSFSSEAVC